MERAAVSTGGEEAVLAWERLVLPDFLRCIDEDVKDLVVIALCRSVDSDFDRAGALLLACQLSFFRDAMRCDEHGVERTIVSCQLMVYMADMASLVIAVAPALSMT